MFDIMFFFAISLFMMNGHGLMVGNCMLDVMFFFAISLLMMNGQSWVKR